MEMKNILFGEKYNERKWILRMEKRRTGFGSLLLACVLFLLNGCGIQTSDSTEIRVTFFDVGKGDAILIETERHSVLIDSGYEIRQRLFWIIWQSGRFSGWII
ncbi:MAG: hypothetical protein HDR06_19295 [Lachnospiraceae bacterium]|nr:hypothetical protein [Lachnospiraceae bacterium]